MSCKHLDEFVRDAAGVDAYKAIHANLISPWTPAGLERKSRACICMFNTGSPAKLSNCNGRSRLHACLHCIHVACTSVNYQPRGQINQFNSGLNHRDCHARENNHPLSVELGHGNVYCADPSCHDYMYNPVLEDISEKLFLRASRRLSINGSVRFTPWRPRKEETALLRKHRKRKGYTSANYNKTVSTVGLRGLINLGNTCFMSCIVQTLVHTPLLRDYFLSDRHLCLFDSGGNNSGNGSDTVEKQCIVCEMARLFQEFYSGAKNPLVPHALLHMTWQHARHLAGYEQQDAHEFFIATLDLLHRDLIHRTESDPSACDCIVDTIFTGKLQSDVVCQACRSVSTTIDPFWDISLDLPANNILPTGKNGNNSISNSTSGSTSMNSTSGGNGSKNMPALNSGPPISLHDCLQRFTKPEHLGSTAKIKCSTCNAYQESTKQLTMKKLPIVASFHLKRFEHSTKLHKKISTRVAFPEHLDMTPFVSHQRNNKRGSSNPKSPSYTSSIENSSEMLGSNMYTLFAVINHIGNIEAGHYTSFVRQYRDKWYRCNDHQIVPSTIKEVLQSEGYLLFYHKQILEYQ